VLQKNKEMKVKETIAFIGKADDSSSSLIRKLARKNYPLVLVTKDDPDLVKLSGQILDETPQADVEIIDCVKEGCWEADVIVLANAVTPEPEWVENIKAVATQKILVYLSFTEKDATYPVEMTKALRRLMPHSKVVQARLNPVSQVVDITGEEGAVATVIDIFSNTDYKTILKRFIET
jgi:hypothetical protein